MKVRWKSDAGLGACQYSLQRPTKVCLGSLTRSTDRTVSPVSHVLDAIPKATMLEQ